MNNVLYLVGYCVLPNILDSKEKEVLDMIIPDSR